MVPTIAWDQGAVKILDQQLLPERVEVITCVDCASVCRAIQDLHIRGAPAIGVAAAMGLALGARQISAQSYQAFCDEFDHLCTEMSAARPTAVNLFWAIERMKRIVHDNDMIEPTTLTQRLVDEAQAILEEDIAMNRAIGAHGAAVIRHGAGVLTHCNAGALATAGYGTALGVIRAAWHLGTHFHVFADETRPVLQGARLTAWELQQEGIPVTVLADSAAGALMKRGDVHCCIVGADRIAANGDVANKIGTYSVAVLAHVHGIPFYVAAPSSTIDPDTHTGASIPIEERAPSEVSCIGNRKVTPDGVSVINPAFDVTPAEYIRGIITERGIFAPEDILRSV